MKTVIDSLKRDLVDPVKSFVEEVHEDTVGDAKKFYSDQAKKMERKAKAAQAQAAIKKEELRREREEMRKQRETTMKRAAILIVCLGVIALLIISTVLNRGI